MSLTLITGGSGSGKSAWAENLAVTLCPGEKLYWATMPPGGPEGAVRIARHRTLRAGKGFRTLECPQLPPAADFPAGGTVLLEDLSNLLANYLFFPHPPQDLAAVLLAGLRPLAARCGHLLVVSNEVFSDGIPYDPETRAFLTHLGTLHRVLAGQADLVVEVVCGLPLVLKGALPHA